MLDTAGELETELGHHILARRDAIVEELFAEARALCEEANDVLKGRKDVKFEGPFIGLACRSRKGRFGPIIVWVRYTIRKRTLSNGSETRFSREIPGRRNFRYPNKTFKGLDELRTARLIEIEARAAALRQKVSQWGAIFAFCEKLTLERAS